MLRQNKRTASPKWIPVTAEDVRRKRMRIIGIACAALFGVAVTIWLIYTRSVDPQQARQAYDAGVRLYSSARYQEAILNFNRALDLDSHLVDAYRARARSYAGEGDVANAIKDFTKVIQLQPKDANALIERGMIYLDRKDYRSVVEDATNALALDSKLDSAYNLRGTALRAMGDSQRAIADFTRAVEIDPNLDNFFQRAATYELLNQHQLALADFDRAIEISPDQPHIYYSRARAKAALGDKTGSEADVRSGRKYDTF